MSLKNPFNTLSEIDVNGRNYRIYSLQKLENEIGVKLSKLPVSIKILLENVLRNYDGEVVTEDHIVSLANWGRKDRNGSDIPYKPARVILQDFTGVPCVVDLAAMRSAMDRLGGDPEQINPIVPVDLVIDHSVQVDYFATEDAFKKNVNREYERNRERYQFLKWAQRSFDNFSVVPPGTGIVHQVNLEYLARVVTTKNIDGVDVAYPDTLVGTDSHTTMINSLSVLGWGVGGIEAEACMLGQPLYMLTPEVIGCKLHGQLSEGVTATDLVLRVTQMLREKGVVGKFVEFYGPGLSKLALSDKATIANMSPEYGATMGFFPVDYETLKYMELTGRDSDLIELVKSYTNHQGLFRTDEKEDPEYSDTLELDISTVEPSLAGPSRPQDRISLSDIKDSFHKSFEQRKGGKGNGIEKSVDIKIDGKDEKVGNGSVVIAAITSCTNTSNPSVMLAAGLVAKNAVERGLDVKSFVKTSLAPGSKVVTDYLNQAGLTEYLEKLGFNLVGYGCTTCIGNSGPLPDAIEEAIKENDLTCASVLSGNRNFEGRIHPYVRFSYLASPPLVVAFALAGTVDIDIYNEPIGKGKDGKDVYMKDIWPSQEAVKKAVESAVSPDMFRNEYSKVFDGDEMWNSLPTSESELYDWDEDSTYVQEPPFFQDFPLEVEAPEDIVKARVLAYLGDSVTTDHISPAGSIPRTGPAGKYLISRSVDPRDFNSFGSRRGNHEVMIRGTFANIRIRNKLVPETEGGYTVHLPEKKEMTIYEASEKYRKEGTPLVVIGGKEYGTGSSRDWAAKGTILLGVKAVIAESYERIHRSNLVGMGVLPLQFSEGESAQSLGLTGFETFEIKGISEGLTPLKELDVTARGEYGSEIKFKAICRLDSKIEVDYLKNEGILQTVLRQMVKNNNP